MAGSDPWAGMVDPRAALAAARRARGALAGFSRVPPESCKSETQSETTTYADFSSSSRISSPASPLKQSSGEKTKEREITCSSSISMTYEGEGQLPGSPTLIADRLGDAAPAKVANPLKYGLTDCDCTTTALAASARAFTVTNTVPSPTAHLSGPLAWRDGLARLDRWTPPCDGFRSGEWEAVHRAVSHFMDHYAAEAATRGWSAIDLFGVHGRAGAARVDSCGALMLPLLRNATALTADVITFGPLTYRRRVMPEAVLVWDLIGEAA